MARRTGCLVGLILLLGGLAASPGLHLDVTVADGATYTLTWEEGPEIEHLARAFMSQHQLSAGKGCRSSEVRRNEQV